MFPVSLGAVVVLLVGFQTSLRQLSGWSVDRLQERLGVQPTPTDIVLLTYDDVTRNQAGAADLLDQPQLMELGQWPIPRSLWGVVIDRLNGLGVKAIGFDVIFDLPGPGDQAFADAMRRFEGPVVLATGLDDADSMEFGTLSSLYRPNLTLLEASPFVSEGHIAVLGLVGGVVRTTPRSFLDFQPSFQLLQPPAAFSERLHQVTGGDRVQKHSHQTWLELLNFYGPPGSFQTVSLWNLLEDQAFTRLKDQKLLDGATVLIANTTIETRDLHPTPFARIEGMPGVEIHATALANLRQGNHFLLMRMNAWVALALFIWSACLLLLMQSVERPERRFALLVGLVSLFIGLTALLAKMQFRLLPVAHLVSTTALVGLLSTGEGVIRLQLHRQRLRSTLSKYLSPAVVAEMTKDMDRLQVSLGGQAYDVIVLMTDIRGFTTKTTQSTDEGTVSELVDRLNTYFTAVVEDLLEMGATVDKYIGDAVLAYFGAPLSQGKEQDAKNAVEAAIRVCKTLDRLNAQWVEQGLDPWEHVVVLSAGSVICGNIGSPRRLDYTVIGDAVNRVSRMEYVAKEHQCQIAASEQVVVLADLQGQARKLGEFPLRGQSVQSVYAIPRTVSPL